MNVIQERLRRRVVPPALVLPRPAAALPFLPFLPFLPRVAAPLPYPAAPRCPNSAHLPTSAISPCNPPLLTRPILTPCANVKYLPRNQVCPLLLSGGKYSLGPAWIRTRAP